MNELHTVQIMFDNGVIMEIESCSDYKIKRDIPCFIVVKNGHNILLPMAHVTCIGYKEDIV